MLYLFASGYEPKHVANLYRTLFLPNNVINIYEYKWESDGDFDCRHISETVYRFLKKKDWLIRKKIVPSYLMREQVMIIFIDRHFNDIDKPYEFYPIRLGEFVACTEISGKVKISVRMKDFIYPKNPSNAEKDLKQECISLPKKDIINGSKQSTYDGYYILRAMSIANKIHYIYGDAAWKNIVNKLITTDLFKSKNNCFLAIDSIDRKRSSVKENQLNLKRELQYEFKFKYKFPNRTNDSKIIVKNNSGVLHTEDLNSSESSFSINYTLSAYSDKLIFNLENPQDKLEGYNGTINISSYKNTALFVLRCVLTLVLIIAYVYLGSVDGTLSTFKFFIELPTRFSGIFIPEVFKLISLLLIGLIYGKKLI